MHSPPYRNEGLPGRQTHFRLIMHEPPASIFSCMGGVGVKLIVYILIQSTSGHTSSSLGDQGTDPCK